MIINSIIGKKEVVSGLSPTDGDYLVRFIDYDGTILKEVYVTSGSAATPPTNPDRTSEGLTFVEWNNSYSSITQDLDVGATYETTDGKSHIFLTANAIVGLSYTMYFTKSDTSELTISWGDGTTDDTSTLNGADSKTHTYASAGDYEITVWISSGSGTFYFGQDSATYSMFAAPERTTITKVYIGEDTTGFNLGTFYSHFGMEYIMIPKNITKIATQCFSNVRNINTIIFPSTAALVAGALNIFSGCYSLRIVIFSMTPTIGGSMGANIFQECHSLKSIVLPNNYVRFNSSTFYNCFALEKIIAKGVNSNTLSPTNLFYYCYSLNEIVLAASYYLDGTIESGLFQHCESLRSLKFGDCSAIGSNAFNTCYNMIEYDFTNCTAVPTLSSTTAFNSINALCVIKVPAALETSWKAATNWSTYANYIVGV